MKNNSKEKQFVMLMQNSKKRELEEKVKISNENMDIKRTKIENEVEIAKFNKKAETLGTITSELIKANKSPTEMREYLQVCREYLDG
jgi:hypothetical protein